MSSEEISRRNRQYTVKRALFKNKTFTFREDSYEEVKKEPQSGMIVTSFGEFESKEEIFEHMTQLIIENGGKIVP
jgi:hypothetical protein